MVDDGDFGTQSGSSYPPSTIPIRGPPQNAPRDNVDDATLHPYSHWAAFKSQPLLSAFSRREDGSGTTHQASYQPSPPPSEGQLVVQRPPIPSCGTQSTESTFPPGPFTAPLLPEESAFFSGETYTTDPAPFRWQGSQGLTLSSNDGYPTFPANIPPPWTPLGYLEAGTIDGEFSASSKIWDPPPPGSETSAFSVFDSTPTTSATSTSTFSSVSTSSEIADSGHFPIDGDDVLECPQCARKFSRRHLLNRHMKLHTKPSKCSVAGCGYSCATPRDLNRHISGKHGMLAESSKKYYCPHHRCKFAARELGKELLFTRLDNAKRHIRAMHPESRLEPRYVRDESYSGS